MKLWKIEAYEKALETQKTKNLSKAFDGMDQHNAWDFETNTDKFCSNWSWKISNWK
jgi:hypothetical protein